MKRLVEANCSRDILTSFDYLIFFRLLYSILRKHWENIVRVKTFDAMPFFIFKPNVILAEICNMRIVSFICLIEIFYGKIRVFFS